MESVDNYKKTLMNIFKDSGVTVQQIDDVIHMVLKNDYITFEFEVNLGIMVEYLTESGDSCLNTNQVDDSKGAVGFNYVAKSRANDKDFNALLNMFPDICHNYLDRFCQERCHLNLEEIIEQLLQNEYKKRETDPLDLWTDLKQMLPDADPNYLRNCAQDLAKSTSEDFDEFVNNAVTNKDYPTMQNYLKEQEIKNEIALYTKNFTVSKFLELIPNPLEKFSNVDNEPVLSKSKNEEADEDFALSFLYNQFPYLRQSDIKKIFLEFNRHIIKTHNKLKLLPKAFRNPRRSAELKECLNIELLQEVTFLKYEKQIRQFIKMKDDRYRQALEEAKMYGLLRTCACCYDDELIPEECLFCNKNCTFCKNCIKLGAENVIGEGGTRFPCLASCDSEFDYSVLKIVLNRRVFQRLCQRKQIEEIKSANIDGLETCPFCDFSMIPSEDDKIFKCKNVECMKESCRECRHLSHVPLRCSEIEYDEDVKIRTYIENKMTEALLRQCWKCSKKFYKESGCNKMTCLCGAKMCYICGQAVESYSHFSRTKCPLYTDNLQQFHLNNVLRGAQAAKNELGVNVNPTKLKFDPSKNIDKQM